MNSGLDNKERSILVFALSITMILIGIALQAAIAGDLKSAREWVSSIVPISGSIFAFIALLRAGRSLDFTSKQFRLSQSGFLEQRVNMLQKNIVRLEGLIKDTEPHFSNVARLYDFMYKEMIKTSDWSVQTYANDIEKELAAIIVKSEALRTDSQEHYLYTILFGHRAGVEVLKQEISELAAAIIVFLEGGEDLFAVNGPRVRAAKENVETIFKDLSAYLIRSRNDYGRHMASNLRELYVAYGSPLPDSIIEPPGTKEKASSDPVAVAEKSARTDHARD